MTRKLHGAVWFRCGAIALLTAIGAAAQSSEGFVPLFNGKDLEGWQGDKELWKIADGVIVGSTHEKTLTANSFLSTEKSYTDFVLRVKVKLENHNSGIQFRSEQLPEFAVAGYQADVAEKVYFGMLYEERKRGILPYWNALSQGERDAINGLDKKGEFNQFEITAQGNRVKISVNGTLTCDFDDPEGAKSGIIALQLHAGPPMRVSFKDIEIKDLSARAELLMPDYDAFRRERFEVTGPRYRTPEGFAVEQVASADLIGSTINMTFDSLGRPTLGAEKKGVYILLDEDKDGQYEGKKIFTEAVETVMGVHWLAPGDLLVQAEGPQGPGLYRLVDQDADDVADTVTLLGLSNGGMGEHGPHTILTGMDGHLYVLYGNHAHPAFAKDPMSPSRNLHEDNLLPRYTDPRGHAANIRVPGGSIQRINPVTGEWSQISGGYRNSYDMALSPSGEIFLFDSDMEWDVGLPWYRPIRVAHIVPGGDYGWRTGSYNMPFYYIDYLPSVDNIGRGSPVGICFYDHDVYPSQFQGALFLGDWSRGRIRVIFPKADGATFTGKTQDFVLGEPLNVTDMDVGPDGLLYYTVGGRGTTGGMYRVRYDGPVAAKVPLKGVDLVARQPMPRSAWGKEAIYTEKTEMGAAWTADMKAALEDTKRPGDERARILEALQIFGPQPDREALIKLARDKDPNVRAAAVFLLGTFRLDQVEGILTHALADSDPVTARRACEAVVRAGLEPTSIIPPSKELRQNLLLLLNHDDRFVRYSARMALVRIDPYHWSRGVLADNLDTRPYGAFEGMLALINVAKTVEDWDAIFAKLDEYGQAEMSDQQLLDYLRLVSLALLREPKAGQAHLEVWQGSSRTDFMAAVGGRLLPKFPHADWRISRELQIVLAYTETPGTIEKLLAWLTPDKPQEEQIHTVYALRTIDGGWTKDQRDQLVAWFDRGREMGGAASMEGYIENMWQDALKILPDDERELALARKQKALDERQAKALALLAEVEGQEKKVSGELAQMSYTELKEYLEYDPMAYRKPSLKHGESVFIKSKCAQCHVFGTVGKGGGPDLSTVTSRFRRGDILESIMFPSKVVSDQYKAVEVELKDLSTVTGMMVSENDTTLTLITALGEKVDLAKIDIEGKKDSAQSIMPEGLLNTMSQGDLVQLIQYLEAGGEEQP